MGDPAGWPTGLSSYAYRWSAAAECAACEGFMDAPGLIRRAAQLGLRGVQICDNMPFQGLSAAALEAIRQEAADLGLFIETGARGTDRDKLLEAILASGRLGSRLLRVVAEIDRSVPAEEIQAQLRRRREDIAAVLPAAREHDLRIALENHATVGSAELLRMVQEIADEAVGVCLDTMNSVLLLERPLETVRALAPHVLSVHLKDFRTEKRPEEFRVYGVPLGEGLLEVGAVLRAVQPHARQPSLHVELYVGRKQDCAATRSWEDECVRRSAACLQRALAELS